MQDWIIRPQLKGVPGVAGVDAIGGYVKQYHVQPDPAKLVALRLCLQRRRSTALEAQQRQHAVPATSSTTARLRRARRRPNLTTADEHRATSSSARAQACPIRVSDVADVRSARELRTGSASENGREVVVGTALMLIGANSRTVAAAVDAKIDGRPPHAAARHRAQDRAQPHPARRRHDRAPSQPTWPKARCWSIVVLFLMLGNFRAALITALVIPLSMLMTAIGMVQARISGNLMSLGAIDFGLIVDGAVIIIENCLRRLAERQHGARPACSTLPGAAGTVRTAASKR